MQDRCRVGPEAIAGVASEPTTGGRSPPSVAAMRNLGVGVIGLFSGLLVGLLITELIARPLVAASDQGSIGSSVPLALLLGFAPPVLAVVGVVVALRVDRAVRRDR